MINNFQIKGLEKLVNSSLIRDVYPMVNHINLLYVDQGYYKDRIIFNIYLNDESITEENMYQKNFDPHYLIDHYVRNYSKYVGIDLSDVKLDLNVRSPKGKIIHSFNNE